MADLKISQLPAATTLTGAELVPVVQSGVTDQTTTGAIAASFSGVWPIANGGTGQGSFTTNGVVYASSGTTLSSGTALVFNGVSLGLGSSSLTGFRFRISGTGTGATTVRGVYNDVQFDTGVTGAGQGYVTSIGVASLTAMGQLQHFVSGQGTIGGGSTITEQDGFVAGAGLTAAATNIGFLAQNAGGAAATAGKTMYAFYGNNATATGGGAAFNVFINGTAPNAFAGNTKFGSTSTPSVAVDVTGAVAATTTVKTGSFIVSTLPSASASGAGARAYVTDATTPVFGAAAVGSGAVPVPVYSNATTWLVG